MSVIAGIKRKLPLGDWAVQPSHRTWLMCESINHHRHFLHAELSTNQWIVRLPSWTTDQESNQSVLKLLVRTTSYCSVVKPGSVKKTCDVLVRCNYYLYCLLLHMSDVRIIKCTLTKKQPTIQKIEQQRATVKIKWVLRSLYFYSGSNPLPDRCLGATM